MAPRITLSAFLLALVLTESSARACCAEPPISFYCCLPGMTFLGFHAALGLSLLAAFIERPFVSRAGLHSKTLAATVQANLIALIATGLAGWFALSLRWGAYGELVVLGWMAAGFAMTTAIEYLWLNAHREANTPPLRPGWIAVGNAVSALVVFLMPSARSIFGTDSYRYIRAIQDWRESIALATLAGAIAVFGLAFARGPAWMTSNRGRGFDVIVRPPESCKVILPQHDRG